MIPEKGIWTRAFELDALSISVPKGGLGPRLRLRGCNLEAIQPRLLLVEHPFQKRPLGLVDFVGDELLEMFDVRSRDEFLHLLRPHSL